MTPAQYISLRLSHAILYGL